MAATWQSIEAISMAVRSGEYNASDLVEQALAAIDQEQSFNAIIASTAERARERAQQIDADPANAGRLAGVPFIAKDNFLTFGAETTAASNILKGFIAPYQSTAIERLEAEGAICVAKANLDAFAHGSSTENSDFMTTSNPHDPARVPGGSSGGSAAAVMLNLAPFALGTDTGGSIRLPASFCGGVGFKPTYGLVSRSGVVAMASSLDVVGPITRTVADSALVLDVIAGQDPFDSTTVQRSSDSYQISAPADLNGVKIGLVEEYMAEGLDKSVRAAMDASVNALQQRGAQIVPISMPTLNLALAVYYILCPAEVSSNLSRYDGQRYGYSNPDAANLEQSIKGSRSTGFGAEAKRRIIMGTYVLSSGYFDAYYKRAQIVRTKIINEYAAAFVSVDYLIGPTAPAPAFRIGENVTDPLQMYLTDIMTVGANLAGLPAVSLPATTSGLPIGIQLLAKQGQDKQLLEVASAVEGII